MIPLALEFHPVPLARPLEHKHFLIILLVMASPGPESAPRQPQSGLLSKQSPMDQRAPNPVSMVLIVLTTISRSIQGE